MMPITNKREFDYLSQMRSNNGTLTQVFEFYLEMFRFTEIISVTIVVVIPCPK